MKTESKTIKLPRLLSTTKVVLLLNRENVMLRIDFVFFKFQNTGFFFSVFENVL